MKYCKFCYKKYPKILSSEIKLKLEFGQSNGLITPYYSCPLCGDFFNVESTNGLLWERGRKNLGEW